MAPGPTALSSLARYAVGAAADFGLATDPLIERAGLSKEAVEDVDGRVPVARLLQLWELAAAESGDPDYGLHVAERFAAPHTIHVIGFAARSAANLGEAIAIVGRFARVVNETTSFELVRGRSLSTLRVEPARPHRRWPRVYADVVLGGYARMGRFFTGEEVECAGATFQHPAPASRGEYERTFGKNLVFGAKHNSISFPTRALDLPVRFADASLRDYLHGRATEMLARLPVAGAVRQRVRQTVAECLTEAPSLASVARRLGMSARTLQRGLRAEGVTFESIRDEVRREVALELIHERRLSMAEIAALVGYADASAFRAAFHRWTGRAPREMRRSTSVAPAAD